MKKLLLILAVIFASHGNTDEIKIDQARANFLKNRRSDPEKTNSK